MFPSRTRHRHSTMRRTLTVVGASAALTLGLAGTAAGEPPGIPDPDTATTQLAELTVAPDGSMDGYDRDRFPHWSDQGDNCNTREVVLKRDGDNVRTGPDCYPTSGTWTSPYDGGEWTQASDLDIDHMVPLANAWRTGASDWSQDRREQFANDLDAAQLWAVTDEVNQDKGDKSPEAWKPPATDYWCTYASAWVGVKHEWQLTVNDAEQATLTDMLGAC